MKRRVAIGKQNFASVREGNYFYIDKTSFLKEWWECGDDATLISRPRRFGKTLNISMMEHFFSNKYSERGDLFEGLSIWQEEKYRQLQGTYPVISLSFAGIKDDTPMQEAYVHGYWKEIVSFMRSLFNSTFKNKSLFGAGFNDGNNKSEQGIHLF